MFKKRYVFTFISLFFAITISITLFGKLIESQLSFYVGEEVNRISKMLIRDVLNKEFLDTLNLNNLFVVERNNDNVVEMIDFNTVKINEILGLINDEVAYYFGEFDHGNVDIIYGSNLFRKHSTGIFLCVPLGSVFRNPIIYNVGPSIPIRLLFSGEVESNIVTSVKQYGINSILLEIDVRIIVTEKIIFPFSSQYIDVSLDFPLVIELISGKVPENYLNNEKFDIIE